MSATALACTSLCLTVIPISGMIMPILGHQGRFEPVPPKKLGRCVADQNTAACSRCAFRSARAKLLCLGAHSGGGHGLWGGSARTCKAGGKRADRGAADWPSEALPGQRGVAAVFGTAEYRVEDSRPCGAAAHALKPLSKTIRAAFVYGSVAKSTDQSASDIDLMIISDSLTYGEVFGALERVTRTVGRKVNPTIYTASEFPKRAQRMRS